MWIYDRYVSLKGGGLCANFEVGTEFVDHLIRLLAVMLFAFIEIRMYETSLIKAAGAVYW